MEDTLKEILTEIRALKSENEQLRTAVRQLNADLKITRINVLSTEEMVSRMVDMRIAIPLSGKSTFK